MEKFFLFLSVVLFLSGCDATSKTKTISTTLTQPPSKADIFDSFGVGVGDGSSFKFSNKYNNGSTYIGLDKFLISSNSFDDSYYKNNIKDYNASAFTELQYYLSKSKFFTIWVTKGWSEDWYDVDAINNLVKDGKIPVFIYWYFGDDLVYDMPDEDEILAYESDVKRFSNLLSDIKTTKLVILEPEFNEDIVLDHLIEFKEVISNAIDTIKQNNSDALLSLCITDNGTRSIYEKDSSCGYENCALGDKRAWSETKPIYDELIDKLDFISFQEMVAQFSRDTSGSDDFSSPIPKKYSDDEIGIYLLPQRIENFSEYLYELYKKPIFLPYITIATATWNDKNNNQTIEDDEIQKDGWEDKAQYVYKNIDKTKLLKNHMFGYSVMSVFDQPDHDKNGYQYFMNNEYHLGIVKSSAPDGSSNGIFGDIELKKDILINIMK